MAVAVALGAAPAVLSVGFTGSSSTIPLMNGGTNFAAGTTVVIGIGTRTGSPVTSATIGGTTLNLIGSQLGNGSDGLQLYYADLSSSTTDTLVVNYANGQVFFLGAAAWILTGAATGGPSASAKNSLTNVPINATLALPSSGAIVALGSTWAAASYTPTWTNMSAGGGDFSISDGGGNLQVLGAHSTAAANPQFTGTGAAFNSGIIAASWAAAAGGAPSGTLATTEAQDAAAFAGTFADQGTLATTEATDTAAFAGSFADTGTLATTEATDTAAFAGTFADQGSFAVTEAKDAAAFNGNVDTSGTFAITEGTDVAAFTGGNVISGTLATTEAIDTATFAGGFSDQGSFALTEAADVTVFAGAFDDEGILAVTDAPDIAAFAGGDSGTLAATEALDIGTFTGDVPSGIDTHDGGSYDYHRYWKGLKDKEDEKRRKRLKAEAVVEVIEEVAEEVAPTAKPENPVKPDYSRVVEKLKEIVVEQTEGRRRLDEERILQLIEDDERELINMVMKLALETAE